ncbi:MAG: outer membrane beta-barrel protein [Elusimicrobia bacterium]|nr:outer membrane beta-barrel protein [Elusimicrobiota bacterium]
MRLRPVVLACALALPAARAAAQAKPAAAEEEEDEEGGQTLEIGLRGSKGREANTKDFDWGPTVSYGILTSPEKRLNRFKYELELSYNDAMTDFQSALSSQATRVRTAEFRYAKLHLLKLLGFDFKKRISIVPYVAGGIQYADSRQDSRAFDEATGEFVSEGQRDRYWSPTVGAGAEVALNKKMTLALDYDQNTEGGDRRVTRLTLELKVAVFGEN